VVLIRRDTEAVSVLGLGMGVLAVLATGSLFDVVMACLFTWIAISVYREL
jgi:hypothetical protein